MFAYCENNPIINKDETGCFTFSVFAAAVVGGAIGGALVSTVSYITSCGISGKAISAGDMINAVVTGAASGAIGGAIGAISLPSVVATTIVKGIASAGLGIAMGIKNGMEYEGPGLAQAWIGISTGVITAAATFAGAQVDTSALPPLETAFANFCTTVSVGTPAEIAAVSSQVVVSSNIPLSSRTQSWSSHMNNKYAQIIESALLP